MVFNQCLKPLANYIIHNFNRYRWISTQTRYMTFQLAYNIIQRVAIDYLFQDLRLHRCFRGINQFVMRTLE